MAGIFTTFPVHAVGDVREGEFTKRDYDEMRRATLQAQRVRNLRQGGRVERCHGIPHLGSYSNAAHQWNCLVLLYVLFPEDYARLSPVVMFHDNPEAWVGDIPSPVQQHSQEAKTAISKMEREITAWLDIPSEHDLSAEDRAKFKACDWLEFMLWCLDQKRMGNQEVNESLIEVQSYIDKLGLPEPAMSFYRELKQSGSLPARAAGVIRKAVSGELNLEKVQVRG